jgi:hypothetical protein
VNRIVALRRPGPYRRGRPGLRAVSSVDIQARPNLSLIVAVYHAKNS